MANLTRDKFIPLFDANAVRRALGIPEVGDGYDWTRYDKSTIFDLSFNPQEETSGYIDMANDTTEITSYQTELPQEIILDNENSCYKLMFPFCMSRPTKGDAVVPHLLVVPDMNTAEPTDAYLWKEAVVSPGDLNTVDGKLSFSLKMNGDSERGTASLADGKWTYSSDTTPSGPVEEAAVFSVKKSTAKAE